MIAGQVIRLLCSLKMVVWLLFVLLMLFLAGAFIMPLREEFQSIHSVPLFQWIREQSPGATWWLWGSTCLLVVFAVSTLVCSIESLVRKRTTRQWLLIVSPQIIHIGFLFMLLAHLLSALGGFKGMAVAQEGALFGLPDKTVLRIENIRISTDPYGYMRDWAVDVRYLSVGTVIREDRIMPNRPSIREGIGVYVKDLRAYPEKAILLEFSREPGVVWALSGGILFTAGTIILLLLKMKREG